MSVSGALADAMPPVPVAFALVVGAVLLAEFVETAEITTNRIIINYLGLLPIDEIFFSDVVSMRMAKGPFDGFSLGRKFGAPLFSRRLIIRLSKRRWLSKTVHLKARNAGKVLNAYNAWAGQA